MDKAKYALPSIPALTAFEAVARLRGFARAAEELNTSQPAISRHIRNLEIRFGTALFDRTSSPITLTSKGVDFYAGISQSLDHLQDTVRTLTRAHGRVTLVCSHSVSHLVVMPRYSQLRRALGPDTDVRILTAEYALTQSAVDTGADILFDYAQSAPKTEHVVMFDEAIKPVGTPAMVAQARAALNGTAPPPPLLNLSKDNFGWMGWGDWMRAHPAYTEWPMGDGFDSYVYLLEAAAQGAGLALGWRGFVDGYIARGTLTEMPVGWHQHGSHFHARLTRFGEKNPAAQKCLAILAQTAKTE